MKENGEEMIEGVGALFILPMVFSTFLTSRHFSMLTRLGNT